MSAAPNSGTTSASTPLPILTPDYVLAVQFPVEDPKQAEPTADAKQNFQKLISALYQKGFTSQVRSDGSSESDLLVFIKLSSYTFADLLEKDSVKNFEFGVTAKNDTVADRLRIIYQYLTSPTFSNGLAITPGKGEWEFITAISPITDIFDESNLAKDVKTQFTDPNFTTNAIKDVFGVQVSLYFEFLKFYIVWLAPLAVIGVVSYFKQKQSFSLTYAFINLLWGIGFLTFWHRKQQYLVNFWGVQNSHKIEEYNSQLAALNQKQEESSSYKHTLSRGGGIRFVKQLSFIPIALLFTAILVSYQLGCFVIEIFLSEIYNGPGKVFLTLVPTILISVFVPVLTIVFNLVTDNVLAWENHDNPYSKTNSALVKSFVLNFLTSYGPLLITSFIYLPFAHLIQPNLKHIHSTISSHVGSNRYVYKYLTNLKSQKDFEINQGRLNVQFFYFIVTNQVIQLLMKYVLPPILGPVIAKVQKLISGSKVEYEVNDDKEEEEWLKHVRRAVKLPEYSVNDDFRGLTIQYGYLILFGPVWSLAPLISIFFNLITFKLDYLKLINGKFFRPPIPTRVDSIHPWNYALFLLTWLGSVISPVITAFYRHGTAPPKTIGQFALDKASINVSSSVVVIFILLASEHLFFILYFIGAKLSDLFKSQAEIDNDFVDNDLKLRRDLYSSNPKSSFTPGDDGEWKNFGADGVLAAALAIPFKNVRNAELARASKEQEQKQQKQQQEREKVAQQNAAQASSSSYAQNDTSGLKNRNATPTISDVNETVGPVGTAVAAAAAAGGVVASSANAAIAQVTDKIKGNDATPEEKQRLIKERQELLKQKEAELKKYGIKEGGVAGTPGALESQRDPGDNVIKSKDSAGNPTYAIIDDNSHVGESNKTGAVNAEDSSSASSSDVDGTAVADTTPGGSQSDNFVTNAKKTANNITGKVDDTLTDGKVNKKKSSLKKLLKKKSGSSK